MSEDMEKVFVKEVMHAFTKLRRDVHFHCSLSAAVENKLEYDGSGFVRVKDVAELVNDRVNPMRLNTEHFLYRDI